MKSVKNIALLGLLIANCGVYAAGGSNPEAQDRTQSVREWATNYACAKGRQTWDNKGKMGMVIAAIVGTHLLTKMQILKDVGVEAYQPERTKVHYLKVAEFLERYLMVKLALKLPEVLQNFLGVRIFATKVPGIQ